MKVQAILSCMNYIMAQDEDIQKRILSRCVELGIDGTELVGILTKNTEEFSKLSDEEATTLLTEVYCEHILLLKAYYDNQDER